MRNVWKEVKKHKVWIGIYLTGVHFLALVGLIFIGVFFAVKFKVTDIPGKVDNLNESFADNAQQSLVLGTVDDKKYEPGKDLEVNGIDSQIEELNKKKKEKIDYLCTLEELSFVAPKNVKKIMAVKKKTNSEIIVKQMIFAVRTHLTDINQLNAEIENCRLNFDNENINEKEISERVEKSQSADIFGWPDKEEWQNVKLSIQKDVDIINKAATVAEIDPRLIVSDLMVEQLRLFFSQRELYKKYFEPLKILANSYKISLGVMAIKEETAVQIENHLKDINSPYYLGEKYEHLLDYPMEADEKTVRFNRLSSEDHYYSYLYAALYLKQIMEQWKKMGYDISNRPEIIGTLFNVGFSQSRPNANPKVGGSTVKIDQTEYSFGRLSYEFFYSGEMVDEFPMKN